MTGLRAAELWGLPAPRTGSYNLAVISEDVALAERATESLEREGLQIRLVGSGAGAESLDDLDRRPTLVVVRCPQDRRALDRILHRSKRRAPGAIVVLVVAEGERIDLGLTLANGADAVVRDEDLEGVLGVVVRAAACGHCSAPTGLMRVIRPPELSVRERQVLGLALSGLSNTQIAERLYLSPSTVKTHISAAFRRLGVHSRREASALVFASDDALQRSMRATLRMTEEAES